MDARKNICVVLVVYQSTIESSNAFASIQRRSESFNMVIVDNSTKPDLILENQTFATQNHIHYISRKENLGLSRAYNLGLDRIRQNPDLGQWILTLDQDTQLSESYLDEILHQSWSASNEVVYCPNVISAQGKISPIALPLHRTKRMHSEVGKTCIGCINSGLLWNLRFLELLRFDENIFLDMIDYDVFMQIHALRLSNRIVVLQSVINQEFSGDSISSFEKDKTRYAIYSKDFTYFCRKWSLSPLYLIQVLLRRALKLSYSHRSLWFVRQTVRVILKKE